MMNGIQDPLAQLRDIHTPAPISFWPPAPGWWLLFTLGLVLIGWGVWWYREWRSSPSRAARIQLKGFRKGYLADHQEGPLVMGLSTLIRRYSLTAFGRERVAGLTGPAWLNFLDKTGRTSAFTSGVGRVLTTAPYGGREPVEGEALIDVVEQWLKMARKEKP